MVYKNHNFLGKMSSSSLKVQSMFLLCKTQTSCVWSLYFNVMILKVFVSAFLFLLIFIQDKPEHFILYLITHIQKIMSWYSFRKNVSIASSSLSIGFPTSLFSFHICSPLRSGLLYPSPFGC